MVEHYYRYDPIVQDDLMASIVDPIYTADLETLHSHRLAVFFMVLANGYLYDTSPTSVTSAREYQALGRAALSFDPILQEVTCATVQAIFLLVRFAYNSDRRTNEERWLLTGLIARISQVVSKINKYLPSRADSNVRSVCVSRCNAHNLKNSIVPERDSEGWNLGQEEVQRRRRVRSPSHLSNFNKHQRYCSFFGNYSHGIPGLYAIFTLLSHIVSHLQGYCQRQTPCTVDSIC